MTIKDEFHCQRCCECSCCSHDAGSFFIEHPDELLSHTFGCKNVKPGEPANNEKGCLYCEDLQAK